MRIALLSAALLLAPGPSWAQTLTVVNGVQVISGNDPAPVRARPKPARAKTRSATRASARSSAVTDESPIADLIVQRALAYQGVPYVFGGTSPRSGFDCSGFVQYVFATVGIRIPRTADAQFAVGRIVPPADPEPGDLVFFQTYDWGASHVGIYLGGGKFVQEIAPNVHISDFNNAYFRRRYIGARRLIPS